MYHPAQQSSVNGEQTESVLGVRDDHGITYESATNQASHLLPPVELSRKTIGKMIVEPAEAHGVSLDASAAALCSANFGLDPDQLSNYLALPRARRPGQPAFAPAPIVDKMVPTSGLPWMSDSLRQAEVLVLSHLQRALQSASILSALQQDLSNATKTASPMRISSLQCFQTLAAMVADDGECLMVALELGLFDYVHALATSMDSEDHVIVLPVLRSLVLMLRNSAICGELRSWEYSTRREMTNSIDISSLYRLIDSSNGVIRTKWALLAHLKYYLQFLDAVSPPDGHVLTEASSLLRSVKECFGELTVPQPLETEFVVTSALAEEQEHPESDCILCKYNVAGTFELFAAVV